MSERLGVAAAVLSSCLGGMAAAVTRYLVDDASPITLAILRWGIGFLLVLPLAIMLRVRWPARRDHAAVVALGVLFFGVFFIFYNLSLSYTTASRASLALSTLPLQTMAVGALFGVEPLTRRKTVGVAIAVIGAALALGADLGNAPAGAWRGELIMGSAVLCMAFYNVFSRPLIERSSALAFLSVGMGSGAAALIVAGSFTGSLGELGTFGEKHWFAGLYLGIGGGALAFILWVVALKRTTPTRVAITMTVNPVAAGLLAQQLVGEPITLSFVLGLGAVFAGIWIAATQSRIAPDPEAD